jgi:hypothetical protein
MQDSLREGVNAELVPHAFRAITEWARRLGIGDDVCRRIVFARLTAEERAAVMHAVDGNASAISKWLDEFESVPMPTEAGAFLYLLLGVEEWRQGS